MKISYISTSYLNKISFNKKKGITPKYNLPQLNCDTISFSSNSRNENPMWIDFQEQVKTIYPDRTPTQVALDAVSKPENKIGEGVKKIVYNIDGIDDYVVAFFKQREPSDENPLVGVKDAFPNYNFGQEIATNNANISVMKKINGKVHSIPDWTSKYQGLVYRGVPITEQDAKIFLAGLLDLEQLPWSSYIDFAQQVKYLNDRRIKIDLFNPNNIIVDMQKEKITHFDLFEKPEIFHPLGKDLNGVQDMINILADALLHGEYAKVLSDEERNLMIKATKRIAEKCTIAGEIVGLSNDPNIAYRTYEFLQDKLHKKDGRNTKYLELYRNFQNLYGIN